MPFFLSTRRGLWAAGACVFALALLPAALAAECVKDYKPGQTLSLAGDWQFMLANFPQAASPDLDDAGWKEVKVPGRFGSHPVTKGQKGDAWYRCRVNLQEADVPEGVALYLGAIQVADQVFFNGAQVGQTGSFTPPLADIEKERLYPLPARLWKEGTNVIAIHIRAVGNASGIYGEPKIGREDTIARYLIVKEIPAVICSLTYLLVAAFFMIFVIFFWHQKQNLYFALFSASLGLYHLIRTPLRYSLFNSFETSFQTELILVILLPPLFMGFLAHLLEIKKPLGARLIELSALLLIVGTLFSRTPERWFLVININLAVILGTLVVVYWIIRKNYAEKKSRLQYILYGFFAMVPAILNDMLVTMGVISTPRVLVFAFLIFLLFVSLGLADSILELYRHMTVQEQELRQMEKRKTSSIFNIASEFNTIFAGLRDAYESMDNGKKKETRSRSAPTEQINTQIINLQNLLNDSTFLALLESGEYTIRRVRFSLRKLCEEVIQRAIAATGKPARRIGSNLPDVDVEIIADPDLISAALYHLVENALLYTPGRIEINAERVPGAVQFQVKDEGPGLSPEQQAVLFQKFVRGVDDNSEIPGSGLGLALVDLIARHLEGSIRLDSGPSFYSNFTLTIPLASEVQAA